MDEPPRDEDAAADVAANGADDGADDDCCGRDTHAVADRALIGPGMLSNLLLMPSGTLMPSCRCSIDVEGLLSTTGFSFMTA